MKIFSRIRGTLALAIAISAAALSLCACADINIYDDNDKLINASTDSSSKFNYVESKLGGTFTASATKFTGTDTVWHISVNEGETWELIYDIEVTDGRLKVIAVGNGELTLLAEGTGKGTAALQKPGSYNVKIVGDNASFSVTLKK